MYPKRTSLSVLNAIERRVSAWKRPGPVFARDDSAGTDNTPSEAISILIVEDDYLVAIQMETALVEAGLESAGIATTAEEAIELAASQHPALAVIDIRLASARDGIDAAIVLLREHGIRSIFATAHHDVHTQSRAAPASPLGWLQKPYSMESLVRVVRKALKGLADRTQ